jgi:PAS domain S-box-containing protein
MPRNGAKFGRLEMKDQILCDLELRQTQSERVIEALEIRRRTLETTLLRFKKLYDNSPIGFLIFDQAGRIMDVNEAALRLLNVGLNSLMGVSISALVTESSTAAFLEHLRKCRRAAGASVTTEVEMITGNSGRVAVQMVSSALVLDHNRIFETALIDLTSQKPLQKKSRAPGNTPTALSRRFRIRCWSSTGAGAFSMRTPLFIFCSKPITARSLIGPSRNCPM